MTRLIYLSHPEVAVDAAIAVTEWGLSDLGRARVQALARAWPLKPVRIITSPERKARETAAILAAHLGLAVEVADDTGEVDRSSTGYVPRDRHEALADALFAHPGVSAAGWETALAAQTRMVGALSRLLAGHQGDLLMVGHGGVGSLLWCHLAGHPIARTEDQPGQGHYWQALLSRDGPMPLHPWQRLERLADTGHGC